MKSYKQLMEEKDLIGKKTHSEEEIAKKHGLSVDYIEKQIEKGKKVEKEHTNNEEEAEEIARDHLWEFPDYYDRLDKMEKQAKKKWEKNLKEVEMDAWDLGNSSGKRFAKGKNALNKTNPTLMNPFPKKLTTDKSSKWERFNHGYWAGMEGEGIVTKSSHKREMEGRKSPYSLKESKNK